MIRIPTHTVPTHPGEMLLEEFLVPMGLRASAKNNSTSCLWFRHLRSIHRHISRYASVDAPWRRTHIRRHIVELFISMTLKR
jgi:hypothetical protein